MNDEQDRVPETKNWKQARASLFRMVSVGVVDEPVNQAYDVLTIGAVVANLIAAILSTFASLDAVYGGLFNTVEAVTTAVFAIDYVLRIVTAQEEYPDKTNGGAILSYCTSAGGIIDLLSFLPFYLPVFFPSGMAAFRMFRVVRILRLFRINAYYDSLNVITEVLLSKKQQLLSSVFIIIVLMLGASLCMYGIEHDAQPEVFSNAFSGIWWAASTLLTVGYGDIYPVTTLGKVFGIVITFLGVGMVAIPTGIISAGFVEQYTRLSQMGTGDLEENVSFIRACVHEDDVWTGHLIEQMKLPQGLLIASIRRGKKVIIPRSNTTLQPGDIVILAAERLKEDEGMEIKKLTIGEDHPWNGLEIRELDISRQSYVVTVWRDGAMLTPRGSLILRAGDQIYLYARIPGVQVHEQEHRV